MNYSTNDAGYIQGQLNTINMINGRELLKQDGQYGDATSQAVRIFQQLAEIPVDGEVGPETLAHLDAAVVEAFLNNDVPLIANDWPLQTQMKSMFGTPSYGAWERAHVMMVSCPWSIYSDNQRVSGIPILKYCAPSLMRVLHSIWRYADQRQDNIVQLKYHIFDGSFVVRNIRNGHGTSMHAYASAIDWDAEDNQQGSQRHEFSEDSPLVRKFKAESWKWGGNWLGRSVDAMHVQAAVVPHGATLGYDEDIDEFGTCAELR